AFGQFLAPRGDGADHKEKRARQECAQYSVHGSLPAKSKLRQSIPRRSQYTKDTNVEVAYENQSCGPAISGAKNELNHHTHVIFRLTAVAVIPSIRLTIVPTEETTCPCFQTFERQ